MANFDGHYAGAAAAGAAVYLGTQSTGAGACAFVGALIPDIDLDHSHISRASKLLSAIVLLTLCDSVISPPIYAVALAMFLYFVLWHTVSAGMRHRGWTHSWFGALGLSMFITWTAATISGSADVMYIQGAMLGILVHFALDDITSVMRGTMKTPVLLCVWRTRNMSGFLVVLSAGVIGLLGLLEKFPKFFSG